LLLVLAGRWKVRRAKRSDSSHFLKLVVALAKFEHLQTPSPAAGRRMVAEIFDRRSIHLLVAESGERLVGYALYFFTYSSFLARPTLYIEDLFVLDEQRGKGIGQSLFLRCAREAAEKGCGRMEWSVLNWNSRAIRFYEGMGARKLGGWSVFRLDAKSLGNLGRKAAH
jgi:GNAT superfamily N-acetyltransferase